MTQIPAGGDWVHEIQLDGFRIAARIEGGAAKLLTRNGLDCIRRAWRARLPNAYLDGGLCAVRPDGTTLFSTLQAAAGWSAGLVYFDLLHIDGEALTRRPLLKHEARLEALSKGAKFAVCEFPADRSKSFGK